MSPVETAHKTAPPGPATTYAVRERLPRRGPSNLQWFSKKQIRDGKKRRQGLVGDCWAFRRKHDGVSYRDSGNDDQQQCRHQPADSPTTGLRKRKGLGFVFAMNDARDRKAGNHEEHIDTDEPASHPLVIEVK